MMHDAAALAPLLERGYHVMQAREGARVWTDDYSDIIGAYRL